jgi:hypothetical protein
VDALRGANAILNALYAQNERYKGIRSAVAGIDHPYVNVGLIGRRDEHERRARQGRAEARPPHDSGRGPCGRRSRDTRGHHRCRRSVPGVRVDIRRMLLARALQPDARNAPLVDALRRHARTVFGQDVPAMGTPLYTDVRLYAAEGAACALYGAGPRTVLESNAKRADEHLVLEDLRGATKVIARTLRDLLQ